MLPTAILYSRSYTASKYSIMDSFLRQQSTRKPPDREQCPSTPVNKFLRLSGTGAQGRMSDCKAPVRSPKTELQWRSSQLYVESA